MNIFVIGTRLEIHHYPDWSGTAFLCYQDEEYRIPGEAAKILADKLLGFQSETRKLEERVLECTLCRKPAGKALLMAEAEGGLQHAMCADCHEEVEKLRKLGVSHLAHAAAERAKKADESGDSE